MGRDVQSKAAAQTTRQEGEVGGVSVLLLWPPPSLLSGGSKQPLALNTDRKCIQVSKASYIFRHCGQRKEGCSQRKEDEGWAHEAGAPFDPPSVGFELLRGKFQGCGACGKEIRVFSSCSGPQMSASPGVMISAT